MSIDLPNGYYSVAQIRQVPDNQEVFVFEDDSVVIELLESAEGSTATEAISFHFDNIKDENEATEGKVDLVEEIDVPLLANGGFGAVLIGKQKIENAEVDMGIILIRLDNIETDILITWHSQNIERNLLIYIAETLQVSNWALFNN